MKVEYDKYYLTENLFGEPYPELIHYYSMITKKGKLLDLGCGQGRDAIALARLGFEVTGIDYSKVGINQLNEIAKKENLLLKGIVADIFEFSDFSEFDFVLLDSMFHFGKREKEKEIALLKKIIRLVKPDTCITVCIQNSGNKIEILNSIISEEQSMEMINKTKLVYEFIDKESNHGSKTKYEMMTIRKKEKPTF
jgi:2-polyprenyl-3-methyl-5-hydroxy-6-metoxy-1,4-benzoquinol methylase